MRGLRVQRGGTLVFADLSLDIAAGRVTGLLGPGSDAHGPNEFLHIPTGRKLTAVLALLLRDHAARAAE